MITVNPTSNQSPDATLGGLAVTTPSNTGHALTQTVSNDGGSTTKTIRWFSFPVVNGTKKLVTLKIDHNTEGVLVGGGALNDYLLEHSTNGGSSWSTTVHRANLTSQVVATVSVPLSVGQDISQVQVRETNFAFTVDPGESAQVASTTSNVRVEIEFVNQAIIVMM